MHRESPLTNRTRRGEAGLSQLIRTSPAYPCRNDPGRDPQKSHPAEPGLSFLTQGITHR